MNESQDMHDTPRASGKDRLLELLADRALFGLDAAEEREVASLLREHPDVDAAGLERLAAATAVALGRSEATPELPVGLRGRLHDDARRFRSPVATARASGRVPIAAAVLATLATAASVAFVVGRRDIDPLPQPAVDPGPAAVAARPALTPAVQREELLATVQDAVVLDCAAAAGDDDSADLPAAGDVVWSPSRQRGFLRIRGLKHNDPARSRYQVWIVDGDRGAPVPCGSFDVANAGGDVVVPIVPRGFVQGPSMFAVTVEEPGGAAGDFNRDRVVARAE